MGVPVGRDVRVTVRLGDGVGDARFVEESEGADVGRVVAEDREGTADTVESGAGVEDSAQPASRQRTRTNPNQKSKFNLLGI